MRGAHPSRDARLHAEFGEQLDDASLDLVNDRLNLIHALAGWVGEVPVEVSLPGEDGKRRRIPW